MSSPMEKGNNFRLEPKEFFEREKRGRKDDKKENEEKKAFFQVIAFHSMSNVK